jgi:hypothetical protein
VTGKFENLAVGTKVRYTGDCVNQEGFGDITRCFSTKWYASQYDIKMLDGREMNGILPSNFGEGKGGHRFELHTESMDARRQRQEEFYAEETRSAKEYDQSRREAWQGNAHKV